MRLAKRSEQVSANAKMLMEAGILSFKIITVSY